MSEQLALNLSSAALPVLPMTRDWGSQPRRFGHGFHPMCTYLGGLPPAMAHALVERFSRPGDVVLDPFCGRGTVPLQAAARRRVGVGVDANPLAHLLSAAALEPPTLRDARDRLSLLRIDWTRDAGSWRGEAQALASGSAVAGALFHPETLAEVLFLRASLDRAVPADRFLLAALAGILHGSRPSYLTDAMPNTFSLAPRYTRAWLASRPGQRPRRDAFVLLAARLERLFRDGAPPTRGIAIHGDARGAAPAVVDALRSRALPDRVRLVVTSPPYLGVVRYGLANWLRLWLLGEDAARIDEAVPNPRTAEASAQLVGAVLDGLRSVLAPDAVVVLVLGDVETDRGRRLRRPLDLAASAWTDAAEPLGYRLAGVVEDPVEDTRKLTRIWGSGAGRATRVDRLLVVAPTEAGVRRARAAAGLPVDWSGAATRLLAGTPARSRTPGGAGSSRPRLDEPDPKVALPDGPPEPVGSGSV
jgi:site-specific DNA-methyltransferase (adenine-specific)